MDVNELQEQILRTANRFGKMKFGKIFPKVSKREFELLAAVQEYMDKNAGKKGIHVSGLAVRLKVSSPAVSRMVGMLEQKGYIGRDIDKEDRRNTYIYLTEKGREVKTSAEEAMRRLTERVLRRMGDEDMQELMMLWNRLADIMEEELRAKDV